MHQVRGKPKKILQAKRKLTGGEKNKNSNKNDTNQTGPIMYNVCFKED